MPAHIAAATVGAYLKTPVASDSAKTQIPDMLSEVQAWRLAFAVDRGVAH